ncbi:Neutral alpha-glucosidase AB precursor, putative [Perkinsus marinus ATCC 50983]|uniref:Neutral alpha-glucosidase AB, putative n=1 Tax=Perkinsus marinus (strain ATCC 50983 / TXsc) TaxID=423536 RepID=C5LNX8_PERM5|nr:Neutral alpha-glucosidase AB precursor, putative [Perkinsus marinus ATCC 50983]EER01560.1 Neutral alpha-glucosidase AB precursor, putative [Perkinsus marinus ATCC 50983]|eukprot:XP_002768842.1 Neutral alpha-glucosidase AB precursor, putative [Perkinsus marinus ATCC 50983]
MASATGFETGPTSLLITEEYTTYGGSAACIHVQRRDEVSGKSLSTQIPDGELQAARTGVYRVPVRSAKIEKLDEPILAAELHFYSDNTVRFIVDENQKLVGNGRKRYRIPSGDVIQDSELQPHGSVRYSYDKQARQSTFDLGDSTLVQVDHDTVVISLMVDGRVVQTINEKQLFVVESAREHYGDICPFAIKQSQDLYLDPACTPQEHPGTWAEEYRELTDYKPHGPSSVALDITFHGRVPALYGLPEKGTRRLKLKIDGDDDNKLYRFFNLGYAAYSVDSGTSALYGTVPTLTALQVLNESEAPVRSSMLWVNPSDTYIALERNEDNSIHSWFLSESGVIDVFLFPQRTAISAMKSYHDVVGYAPLPPYFSLGFHRSHYSYESQRDILDIVDNYTDLHIPVDVFWLDIEHTNGKQYFTWNQTLFPDPLKMVQRVNSLGKEMVTIVDPHLKATRRKCFLRKFQFQLKCGSYTGEVFKGLCWPGVSAWPDFTSPRVRQWWAKLFEPDGVNEYFYTWNDMNEPSVFQDMEMTMNRDLVHAGEVEHRDVHNAYGHYFRMATFEGHLKYRRPGKRPFVLTRSFYVGSHRFGPMWNGDSLSQWDNLQAVLPMFMTLSAPGGYSFTGSDVGGFTGLPSAELLTRWNQLAAATSVFYRLHSDIVSPPRDPWLYDDRTLKRFRDAVRDRYQLLPFWYTLFACYSMSGEPMLRPLWFDYMHDANTFDSNNDEGDTLQQAILGTDILVRGVTEEGVSEVKVYLPAGTQWYDDDHKVSVTPANSESLLLIQIISGGSLQTVAVTLDKIPRFYRAGSIIPRKARVRDSTKGSEVDPLTMWINEDPESHGAEGYVYLDDGSSYNSTSSGQYALYKIRFNRPNITIYRESGTGDFPLIIDRIKLVSSPQGLVNSTKVDPVTVEINPPMTVKYDEMSFRIEGNILETEARLPSQGAIDILVE